MIPAVEALLSVGVKMDCSVREFDGKHVAGLGVVWDSVQLVAVPHEHHATGSLAVGEAGLLVVIQKTHPLCRLREKTPALLPTLGDGQRNVYTPLAIMPVYTH